MATKSLELLKALEYLNKYHLDELVLNNLNKGTLDNIKKNFKYDDENGFIFLNFRCTQLFGNTGIQYSCGECIFQNSLNRSSSFSNSSRCGLGWVFDNFAKNNNDTLDIDEFYKNCEAIWRLMNEFN